VLRRLSFRLTVFALVGFLAVLPARCRPDLQIGGTPTFIIARGATDTLNGVKMDGAQSYPAFQLKINELLK
jgi:hypothetical protein